MEAIDVKAKTVVVFKKNLVVFLFYFQIRDQAIREYFVFDF